MRWVTAMFYVDRLVASIYKSYKAKRFTTLIHNIFNRKHSFVLAIISTPEPFYFIFLQFNGELPLGSGSIIVCINAGCFGALLLLCPLPPHR